MKKDKKSYKYISQEDLKKLKDAPNSGVIIKKCVHHIALAPYHLRDVKKSIKEILNDGIATFNKKLDGILMGYDHIKVLNSYAPILNDSCYMHINVEAEFYLFKPKIGDIMNGIVNKKSETHVGCLVHKLFNVSITKPENNDNWLGNKVQIGQEIQFKINFLRLNELPYIRGTLLSIISDDSGFSTSEDVPTFSMKNPKWAVSPNKPKKLDINFTSIVIRPANAQNDSLQKGNEAQEESYTKKKKKKKRSDENENNNTESVPSTPKPKDENLQNQEPDQKQEKHEKNLSTQTYSTCSIETGISEIFEKVKKSKKKMKQLNSSQIDLNELFENEKQNSSEKLNKAKDKTDIEGVKTKREKTKKSTPLPSPGDIFNSTKFDESSNAKMIPCDLSMISKEAPLNDINAKSEKKSKKNKIKQENISEFNLDFLFKTPKKERDRKISQCSTDDEKGNKTPKKLLKSFEKPDPDLDLSFKAKVKKEPKIKIESTSDAESKSCLNLSSLDKDMPNSELIVKTPKKKRDRTTSVSSKLSFDLYDSNENSKTPKKSKIEGLEELDKIFTSAIPSKRKRSQSLSHNLVSQDMFAEESQENNLNSKEFSELDKIFKMEAKRKRTISASSNASKTDEERKRKKSKKHKENEADSLPELNLDLLFNSSLNSGKVDNIMSQKVKKKFSNSTSNICTLGKEIILPPDSDMEQILKSSEEKVKKKKRRRTVSEKPVESSDFLESIFPSKKKVKK